MTYICLNIVTNKLGSHYDLSHIRTLSLFSNFSNIKLYQTILFLYIYSIYSHPNVHFNENMTCLSELNFRVINIIKSYYLITSFNLM